MATQQGVSDPFPTTNVVFHEPAVYAAELERVFQGGWTFLLCTDQAPRPGRSLMHPVAGGEVQVRQEPGPAGPRLQVSREGRPLPVEWLGRFAFVHLGGEPSRSLADELGPAAKIALGISADAALNLFEVRMEIAGNWKLVVSGAIEDYHLPFVHGQTVNPWRSEAAVPTLHPRGHSSYETPAQVGKALRALHWGLAGDPPRETFENILIYPNLLLIRLWGLIHVTVFVPQGPAKTLRITRLYSPAPPPARRPLRAAIGAILRIGIQKTFREDRAIVEEAQIGTLAGRDLPRGPGHVEEARVEHFLAETAARVRGESCPQRTR